MAVHVRIVVEAEPPVRIKRYQVSYIQLPSYTKVGARMVWWGSARPRLILDRVADRQWVAAAIQKCRALTSDCPSPSSSVD
jgi:hypothetical protein